MQHDDPSLPARRSFRSSSPCFARQDAGCAGSSLARWRAGPRASSRRRPRSGRPARRSAPRRGLSVRRSRGGGVGSDGAADERRVIRASEIQRRRKDGTTWWCVSSDDLRTSVEYQKQARDRAALTEPRKGPRRGAARFPHEDGEVRIRGLEAAVVALDVLPVSAREGDERRKHGEVSVSVLLRGYTECCAVLSWRIPLPASAGRKGPLVCTSLPSRAARHPFGIATLLPGSSSLSHADARLFLPFNSASAIPLPSDPVMLPFQPHRNRVRFAALDPLSAAGPWRFLT